MPIQLYKPIGKTPLELVEEYKKQHNIKKACFAGRLDPMAHGVMTILLNEECKKLDSYCGKDKVYEFKILYGFETDTYDVLGKLLSATKPNEDIINSLDMSNYIGEFKQKYPPYSSIVVNKKPLWEWAKLNLLHTIDIPSKKVNIEYINISNIKQEICDNTSLKQHIFKMINSLKNTNKPKFRADEILSIWETNFNVLSDYKPIIRSYKAKVSSGTYIRGLVNQIGKDIGCGAIALDIKRTKII